MMNQMAAASAMFFGIPGFFLPRMPPPQFAPEGTLPALSYYDTEPLRATLEELVDFDRINGGDIRLSLGAVNARTGESVYFDSTTHTIGASHVMASGALPPGFPPVEIDGEYYFDGGIMSNTPLQYVAKDFRMNALIVAVDLFSGLGELPQNLDQVQERVKDISFQSKTRFSHDQVRADRGDAQHAGRRHRQAAGEAARRSAGEEARGDQPTRPAVAGPPDQPATTRSRPTSRTTSSRARPSTNSGRPGTTTCRRCCSTRKPAASPTWATACACSISSRETHERVLHERRRSQETRLRDAAHQPGVSAGPVPLRQPRVLHHHLPHRSRMR